MVFSENRKGIGEVANQLSSRGNDHVMRGQHRQNPSARRGGGDKEPAGLGDEAVAAADSRVAAFEVCGFIWLVGENHWEPQRGYGFVSEDKMMRTYGLPSIFPGEGGKLDGHRGSIGAASDLGFQVQGILFEEGDPFRYR